MEPNMQKTIKVTPVDGTIQNTHTNIDSNVGPSHAAIQEILHKLLDSAIDIIDMNGIQRTRI